MRQDRPEDFLAGDAVAGGDVGEITRREPETLRGQVAPALGEIGAFADAAVDEFADAVQLLARIDRADVGVFVERIADAQRLDAVFEFAQDLAVDAFLDEESRAGAADVTLVEVNSVDDAFDRLIDRRVVHDDVGGLSAEFEGEFFAGAGDGAGDLFPDLGRAGEGDLVDSRMGDEGGAGLAGAGDDVDDAVGEAGVLEESARGAGRCSGVVSAGLRTTVFPQASAGAIFHAAMRSGKFHGMICAATPSGRGLRPGNANSSLSAHPA